MFEGGSKSFRPDQLFKVTEIKQLCYFSIYSPFISTHTDADTLTSSQMALYIPRRIFHLARLLYVRPETFVPTHVHMVYITYIIILYILYYNLMGPPSYVRSVFDRNVVMRRITVLSSPCQSNKRYHAPSTQRKKKTLPPQRSRTEDGDQCYYETLPATYQTTCHNPQGPVSNTNFCKLQASEVSVGQKPPDCWNRGENPVEGVDVRLLCLLCVAYAAACAKS